MLTFKKKHLNVILEHCQREYPFEACGLLVGKNGEVEEVFAANNAKKSKTEYVVESREQFKVFEKIRREKKELLGIFHSHPTSSAYPSAADRELAFYMGVDYVIVSLQDSSKPEIRSFKIKQGR